VGTRSQRLRPPLRPTPLSLLGLTAFAIVCLVAAACGSDLPHASADNLAQNPASQLGKLLRIDVDRAGAEWEMAGLGLRNPWRFSLDRKNGDLYIGDVGQSTLEKTAPFTIEGLSSFGETARGELVAASFSQGAVFRLTAG
jgi:hypothetical protein